MAKIVTKKELADNVTLFEIEAPEIARKRKAGQFVILRLGEDSERIPLTIAGSDPERGTVTLVIQAVGKSTTEFCACGEGTDICDVVGPLGKPTHIENFGNVVVIGGGVGIAPALPIAAALKEGGCRVTALISGRTKELVILRDEMTAASDALQVATDDGSEGFHGFPTQILQEMIDKGETINLVVAVGPVPLMRAVCKVTAPHGIQTMVSLNPIMIDGTGMCGGCRVTVGGERRFACVDGPEFDGHQVDFDELVKRQAWYKEHEAESMELHTKNCKLNTTRGA